MPREIQKMAFSVLIFSECFGNPIELQLIGYSFSNMQCHCLHFVGKKSASHLCYRNKACISIWHLLCKIHKFDWSIMERARKGNSLISFTIWILQSYSALYLRVCTIANFLLNPDLFWHLWCRANLITYDFTDSVTTYKSKRKISGHFLSSTTRTSKESINTGCIAWQHSSLLWIQ